MAYGVLGMVAAFPEYKGPNVKALEAGRDPGGGIPTILHTATPEQRKRGAKLVDGAEWTAALAKFLPTGEEGMMPLFAAIAHGCAAGRHEEAFNEVYWPRVARGNEKFATSKLGLYGSDLAALAHFFAEPFALPAPQLTPARQALVLNAAGFHLRALGRLGEAVAPMRAGIKGSADERDWKGAAVDASNLSELLLTLGKLADGAAGAEPGAVTAAADSVIYADRSGDAFERMCNRTTHADALHQAGRWREAVAHFTEVEILQREWQPGLPLLYSAQGYRWCDLKLAQGRAAEVTARYNLLVSWRQEGYSLLDRALEDLTAGRAALQTGANAGQPLDAAVDGLRAAGQVWFLSPGLLARAAFHRLAGNDKLAARDLSEAFDIAERGGMRLFLADAWLESARQRLHRPSPTDAALEAARNALDKAGKLIRETRYNRRLPDLALVSAELALARGDAAAARPHLASVLETLRDNDLWGFMPDLDRLAARYPECGLAAEFSALEAARAAFDREADAAFAAARKVRRKDGLDDDVIDAMADQLLGGQRAFLAKVLADNGHDLDKLSPDQQRKAARELAALVLKQQANSPASPPPTAPPPPPRPGIVARLWGRFTGKP